MTTEFAKKVLSGKKKLLNLSEVLWVNNVPRYKEINVKTIWDKAKTDNSIKAYFPDFNEKRYPRKAYLFNVINTVQPNTMMNYIKKIKKDREQIEIDEAPIVIT